MSINQSMLITRSRAVKIEDIINHPNKILIQSFLVRLRIFSSKKWDAINVLFGSNLLYDCFGELQHQLRLIEKYHIICAMLETLLSRSDLCKKEAFSRLIKLSNKKKKLFLYLERDSSEILTRNHPHVVISYSNSK